MVFMDISIKVSDVLSDNFKESFKSIVDCEHYIHVEKGGRGSGKSVCIGEAIVIGVMKHKQSACVIMKYNADLKTKVVDNFTFCINNLGLKQFWKLRQKPWEYVLLDKCKRETDVSIRFFGCDNEQDSKGFKARNGDGFKWTWFEEANRFKSWNVIQSIIDTTDRYSGSSTVILSYNPPKDVDNYVNTYFIQLFGQNCGKSIGFDTNTIYKESEYEKAGVKKKVINMMHHSTYLDLVEAGKEQWINDNWFQNAERSRENNNIFWLWNYCGMVTGSGATILNNIREWVYDEYIGGKVHSVLIHYGLDASNMGADPWALVKLLWVPDVRDLYILDERIIQGRLEDSELAYDKYREVACAIKELNPDGKFMYGDGAVPANIQMLSKDFGINITNAKSGKGRHYNKMSAITWIAGLNNIYVDKNRTPQCNKELRQWSYMIDPKTDKIDYSKPPDGNDHCCDAIIYALIDYITVWGGREA